MLMCVFVCEWQWESKLGLTVLRAYVCVWEGRNEMTRQVKSAFQTQSNNDRRATTTVLGNSLFATACALAQRFSAAQSTITMTVLNPAAQIMLYLKAHKYRTLQMNFTLRKNDDGQFYFLLYMYSNSVSTQVVAWQSDCIVWAHKLWA